MEKTNELEFLKLHRQLQERYIYYLVALSIAGIGFSVTQTMNVPFSFRQIPLLIAVIGWGLSVHNGLLLLKNLLTITLDNFYLVKAPNTTSPFEHLAAEISKDNIRSKIRVTADKIIVQFSRTHSMFYLGIIMFVIWRLVEMYHLS